MQVMGIFCVKCWTFIYSRAQHDFVKCDCGGCFVDGGQQGGYTRTGADLKNGCIPISARVDITNAGLEKLYADWNQDMGHFGRLNLHELGIHKTIIIRSGKTMRAPGETCKVRLCLWLRRKMLSVRLQSWLMDMFTAVEKGYLILVLASEGGYGQA